MSRLILLLFGITLLGALLRFFNLSPFTIYPDSYQNLIVAHNIAAYHSVTGFLGTNGMFYPDFFMWSRPLFPLLINTVTLFGVTPLLAARCSAFVLGIFAIPMSYLYIRNVFKSTTIGLIAAFLLALSYNHTVWSGLLMTEAIGVFFMMSFLWRFFATVEKTSVLFSLQNMLTGVLFALAVLARYEYFIVVIPLLLYALKKSPKPSAFLITVFSSTVLILLLTGFLLYPLNSVAQVVLQQLSGLLIKIVIAISVVALVSVVFWLFLKRYRERFSHLVPNGISMLLGFFFVVFILLLLFHSSHIFGLDVSMFTNFFRHDFLLSLFAFIGLEKMLEDKKEQVLAYFVLLSVVFLGFIYYQINPAMERYMTHLIPFLLIPAAYGVQFFFKNAYTNQTAKMRYFLSGMLMLFVVSQMVITARGLRNLNDPSWYRTSYEQKAAELVSQKIQGKPLVIVSSPEPYFYFTGLSTQSIADTPPFLYLPPMHDNQQIVIVEDMGMHEYFPNFTTVLDTKFKNYKVSSFWVNEQYHVTDQSISEMYPVTLYFIRSEMLKKMLH